MVEMIDTMISWGRGFTFCIGLLPGCFVMCGIGFISSMSEEVAVPTKQVSGKDSNELVLSILTT